MSRLEFEVNWLPSTSHGTQEEQATAAELKITVADEVVTRVEDSWAKTIRESVRLPAWPLAMWFASSWWRLRWESGGESRDPTTSFRTAHELSSVGGGFIWPHLSFRTDGERVEIVSSRSGRAMSEPVRYLSDFRVSIPAEAFERSVGDFVELVLARLDALGAGGSELHDLWRELRDERADPDLSEYRRIEARLGFDPDEPKPEVVEAFLDLEERIGKGAASEVANMGGVTQPLKAIAALEKLTGQPGVEANFSAFSSRGRSAARGGTGEVAAADRGRKLARSFRGALKLKGDPLTDAQLSELLGTDDWEAPQGERRPPIGLAVLENQSARLYFKRRHSSGRRFEAARFVGDYLLSGKEDRWLPLTDAETARQKIQRAFAAEFLAPIDSLKDRLGGDFSQEAIGEVAEEFGVSQLMVWSSLANTGVISPDRVPSR